MFDEYKDWDDFFGSEEVERDLAATYEFIDWVELQGFNDIPTEGEIIQEHFDRWHGRRQGKHCK